MTTTAEGCCCRILGSRSASPGMGQLSLGWETPLPLASPVGDQQHSRPLQRARLVGVFFLLFIQMLLLAEWSQDVVKQYKHHPSAGLAAHPASPGKQPALCNTEFPPRCWEREKAAVGAGCETRPWGIAHAGEPARADEHAPWGCKSCRAQTRCRCTEFPKQLCKVRQHHEGEFGRKLKRWPKISSWGMCSGSRMGTADGQPSA